MFHLQVLFNLCINDVKIKFVAKSAIHVRFSTILICHIAKMLLLKKIIFLYNSFVRTSYNYVSWKRCDISWYHEEKQKFFWMTVRRVRHKNKIFKAILSALNYGFVKMKKFMKHLESGTDLQKWGPRASSLIGGPLPSNSTRR